MFPSFEIFNSKIFLYPLIMGLAWGAGINLVLFYNQKLNLHIQKLKWIIFAQFVSGWIGAKILFIISSPVGTEIPNNLNFWLGGGFVFYGGLLGAGIVTIFFIFSGLISWRQTNIFIPALAIGHGIGRVGCFMAGCCFGKSCELPWAIHMHGEFRHPVQLYETIALLGLFILFHKKLLKSPEIILWPYYMMAYGFIRIIMEFFRDDIIRGVHSTGISTSQFVSIGMIVISLCFLMLRRRN